MSKAERKREARERRDQARAARKAENRDASFDGTQDRRGDEPAPALGDGGAGRSTARQNSGQGGTGVLSTGEGARATSAVDIRREFELRLDPKVREAILNARGGLTEEHKLDHLAARGEDGLRDVRDKVAEARVRVDESDGGDSAGNAVHCQGARSPRELQTQGQSPKRRISDQRALEMLEDAAEACHEVLLMVRDALRGVSPERRQEAREILNEKPVRGVDGRKQPRRAPDPVVTLMKLELQASSLVKRILAKTNPNVGKNAA